MHDERWAMDRFAERGVAGPFRAMSADDACRLCQYVERHVLPIEPPTGQSRVQSRHLDSPTLLSVCLDPGILANISRALGREFVLWRSNFFAKPPGAPELPWHRDSDHWGDVLVPRRNVSAWLALEQTSTQNGCVRVLPGSPGMQFVSSQDGKFVLSDDTLAASAIDMELEPGQYFLFDQSLVHSSRPNTSNRGRLALAVRYTTADVAVASERIFPGHRCIPVRVDEAHDLPPA